MNIHFEQANLTHKEIIFNWLEETHIKEFWDNSQEHQNDIMNRCVSLCRTFFKRIKIYQKFNGSGV